MIYTERTVTVKSGKSSIDEPVILFRGDRGLEVRFLINETKLKYYSSTNLIEKIHATYGQLVIDKPDGSDIFSDVTETKDGAIVFTITADMIDEIPEVGFYTFQIRLYDDEKVSRVSIPPIEQGIEVREPLALEGEESGTEAIVDEGAVGYAMVRETEEVVDTFDDAGNYNKTVWATGDKITEGKLNKMEDALDILNQNDKNNYTVLNLKINELRDNIGNGDNVGGGVDNSDLLSSNNMATTSPRTVGYIYGSNVAMENATYMYFECPVEQGVNYTIYPRTRRVCYRDSDGVFINMDETVNTNAVVTVTPAQSGIMYVNMFVSDLARIKIYKDEGQSLSDILAYGKYQLTDDVSLTGHVDFLNLREDIQSATDTVQSLVVNNNLLTDAEHAEGYMYMGNQGANASQANRDYDWYKVKLQAGKTYTIYPKARILSIFSEYGVHEKTDNTAAVNTGNPITYTPDTDKIVYITFMSADRGKYFVSTESDPALVTKIGENQLNPNITIPQLSEQSVSGNILYNKKWAVIGDSFTAGDYTGFTDSQGLTGKDSPELYDPSTQMWTTYPWWIMKRNDMQILNFYRSGRTLATPADGTFTNSITYNDMYKQIDADVDYITIYLGINDGHHMPGTTGDDGEDTTGAIPIGTENDNTTATFYGAWNVMLRDLITLYPFAHIGIIVSNGMDTDEHVTATIKMAKKWGIPYLDMNSGYDVPLMIRSRLGVRTETCAEALNIRKQQQQCTATNTHPNPQTHKYQSTFIEAFLRRI